MIGFVFLDLDDTILDFHKAEALALSQMLRELNIVPTPERLALYSEINAAQWRRLETGEITRAEAAVMLDRTFPAAESVEAGAMEISDSVPAWAAQSVARLTQANVYACGADPDAPIARAEAAQMIVNAMDAA